MQSTYVLDLREAVERLVVSFPHIRRIYLFGSRAQRTGSLRSDADLLIVGQASIPQLSHWRVEQALKPLDLFTTDPGLTSATSAVNGSQIFSPEDRSLIDLLGAVPMWDCDTGFSTTFDDWHQVVAADVDFRGTILPIPPADAAWEHYVRSLSQQRLPNTAVGDSWESVGRELSTKIEHALSMKHAYNPRAKKLNGETARPDDEYDFQNLIALVLKPWIPSLEREPFTVNYAGQEKRADFAAMGGRLVIEAKFVRNAGEAASVVKSLQGLSDIYQNSPNIALLCFWILSRHDIDWSGVISGVTPRPGTSLVVRAFKG